jgi:hypothetical protein
MRLFFNMGQNERRQMVEILLKSFIIGEGEISINLCYLPSFEDMANGQRTV